MPKSFQIEISQSEQSKLVDRIEQDFLLAKASHLRWSERCAGWMKKWEARVGPAKVGDEGKPNHVVPLMQWQCFNKLARDMQALLGDDAEITAKATGPSDAAKVAKIGRYMTSRVFEQMELINPLCVFEFRRILNGWSCAYRPWWRREFTTLVNGKPKRVCDYEGPGFFPQEPDDIVIPPERGVTSIQDFSYVIRRVRVTVDDLVRGDGTLYQGTSDPEMVAKLISWAEQGPSNDYTLQGQDPVRTERERSEGVDYDAFMLGRRSLWMWEWYGHWRPLKKQKGDAQVDDLEKRDTFEADWVVKYLPGLRQIVGVQDLLQLYPKMRKRRPFVESTLIKDGSYRPKGFGALLEDIEDEATSNSRLFTAAGELSVWPIVFYRPGAGMNPGAMRLEAGMAYPTEDPASVNVVKLTPNLEFAIQRQQDLLAMGERVTGITDQSLGRAIDRPNAPRTASGQLALIEEGNVRAYLDSTILKEDMEQIIGDFWNLDCDLVPKTQPGLFFRVTEEQAGGLFDIRQGGAYMTPKEFGGTYDFRLKFATSVWARRAKKQELLDFAGMAMQNPLIAQNPLALWEITNRVAREFGISDFNAMVPRPPALDRPKNPSDEWVEMKEGETVQVNPQDNDALHIYEHQQELEDERKDPDRDERAIFLMVKHIMDHQQQVRTKQMMSAMTAQLMAHLNPMFDNMDPQAVQLQLQQMQQQVQQMQAMQAQQRPGIGAPGPGGPPPGGPPQPMQVPPPAAQPGQLPPPPQQVGATPPQTILPG
jgi:hypothetical protein